MTITTLWLLVSVYLSFSRTMSSPTDLLGALALFKIQKIEKIIEGLHPQFDWFYDVVQGSDMSGHVKYEGLCRIQALQDECHFHRRYLAWLRRDISSVPLPVRYF